jgi:hypothetical protein
VSAVLLYNYILASDGSTIPPSPEITGVAYFVGVISALLIGVPIHQILSSHHYTSYIFYLISGFLGGLVSLVLLSLINQVPLDNVVFTIFGVLGAVISSCLCLIVVYSSQK